MKRDGEWGGSVLKRLVSFSSTIDTVQKLIKRRADI